MGSRWVNTIIEMIFQCVHECVHVQTPLQLLLTCEYLSLTCDAVEIFGPIILFLSLCRMFGHIKPTCPPVGEVDYWCVN